MEFDLDLEDLDLKSVDMSSNTNSQSRNISLNTPNSAFKPNIREQSPNLTISTNNYDAMPSSSMNDFNSDKEVDFGLDLLVNKKKQKSEAEITKLIVLDKIL